MRRLAAYRRSKALACVGQSSSAPPAIITSCAPLRMDSKAKPMPWLPEVQALEVGITRPVSPKKMETFPAATVPGTLHDVDFMVKDTKRFADSGGWGYAQFNYDAKSDTFTPGTTAGSPPQGNDAKCGFVCHTRAKARDYVFTEYGRR